MFPENSKYGSTLWCSRASEKFRNEFRDGAFSYALRHFEKSLIFLKKLQIKNFTIKLAEPVCSATLTYFTMVTVVYTYRT